MKFSIILLTAFFFFYFSSFVFAHGGFEKQAGDITVYINQTPVSPLVGEKVDIYANFKDQGRKATTSLNDKNLVNWPVELTLIDTYYGDESKDRVILKKGIKTDVNGGIEFSYTFNKENYFDIEFLLKDSKGNLQKTGFLIQPRNQFTANLPYVIGIFAGGMLFYFLLNKYVLKKKN